MKSIAELAHNDAALLEAVLADDRVTDEDRIVFTDMWKKIRMRGGSLSEVQRGWVEDVAKSLDIAEPAANLVSEGLVPRGREVPTPSILKHRPLKPPGR